MPTPAPTRAPDARIPRRLLLFGLLLLAAAYARALAFSFIIDDSQLILGDLRIRHLDCLGRVLNANFFAGTTATGEFYRPLSNAWFVLNYTVFGLHPMGWHLTSILLHVAATLALFALLSRVLNDRLAAAAAALLFAVMPIHAEPVLWLSSAGDELAALFLFLALLALDHALAEARRRILWALAAPLAYVICLGSKESSTLFVIIFSVAIWQRSSGTISQRLARCLAYLIPFVVVDLAFIAIRSHVLGRAHIQLQSLHEFFATVPRIAAFYLYKLLLPFFPAEFHNLRRTPNPTSLPSLACFVLLLLVATACIYLWRESPRTRVPIAIVIIPLTPAIAATLFVIDLVHDRYLYLPSSGVAALAGIGFATTVRARPELQRALALLLIGLSFAMAINLAIESGKWHDDWTLASASIHSAPNSAEANIYYGNMLLARDRADLAATYFQHAIDIYPADYWAITQLGDVELRAGDTVNAEHNYQRAIELAAHRGTPDGVPYSRLALIAESQGSPQQAIAYVQIALRIDPEVAPLHRQLAHLYEISGNATAALQETARVQALTSVEDCHPR